MARWHRSWRAISRRVVGDIASKLGQSRLTRCFNNMHLLSCYVIVLALPVFSDRIPAVRFDRRTGGRGIYRTGLEGETEALSFAYQVDMAIVNGEAPPTREGIFRPYFECWRAFIDHLDNKIRHYRHEDLQILRLDITGFYEFVRPEVVGDALQGPLERALGHFAQADGGPMGSPRCSFPIPVQMRLVVQTSLPTSCSVMPSTMSTQIPNQANLRVLGAFRKVLTYQLILQTFRFSSLMT